MQIHSISQLIATPFMIWVGGMIFYSYTYNKEYSVLIFIPVTVLVALYVFHGPLDHWWKSKYPIKLDPKLKTWLSSHFSYYITLHKLDLEKFDYRMGLYLDGRLFKSIGAEQRDVPEDIKCMVAAHGIRMNMGLDDYLIGDMDRIFLYKHPFPSPAMPFLHTVETNIEDGVIILSLEQLTNAVLYPTDYYNIAYHAYAEAFIGVRKNYQYPDTTDTWEGIERVSGFSKELLISQTGLPDLTLLPVHMTCFFTFSPSYKTVFPDLYEKFSTIFGQRP
jgi:hypothetical protein